MALVFSWAYRRRSLKGFAVMKAMTPLKGIFTKRGSMVQWQGVEPGRRPPPLPWLWRCFGKAARTNQKVDDIVSGRCGQRQVNCCTTFFRHEFF